MLSLDEEHFAEEIRNTAALSGKWMEIRVRRTQMDPEFPLNLKV